MSADSAVSIAWDLLKWAVTAIKRPIRYVMSSKSFADSLQEEVQNLDDEVRRVNVLAEQAGNNVRKFHDVFTRWEKKSDDALKEVQDLLGDFENATKTCCYGTLPDPKCRYQFSRMAEGKIKVIKQLAQQCSGFKELNDISYSDPAPGNVTATNPARREGKDIVQSTTATASSSSASTSNEPSEDGVFESRTAIIRDIMGALADNSNSVVGVYGMGGVGKSTLLVGVERRIREEKQFDLIAKADVSQNPDIKMIQERIAHALGLDMKDYDYESMRADHLRKRLGNEEKKVLIILDNLWKGLDLKSVGIPCGYDDKVMGCKLLLTSRDQNVLQREMGCDKGFFLNRLEEKEAKILFERMVGDKVHNDEFRPMVNKALRKCAGLPLLIVTMAKHFRCSRSPEWRNALNQIERCSNKGLSAMINMMLQLSYDHLESEEAKKLLQLCVACGVSNSSVENLVRYGYGLGIFQKDSSMEDARDEVSTLIHTLQASSLLLDNGGANAFKIHDLVRDFVAQFILKDRPLLMLKDKDMLASQLQNERLKSCSAIYFPYIDMKELPKELDCPELRIFLFFNYMSLEIPDSFFNSMKKLVVLHLSFVRITHSLTPFQFLENLRTLCLQHCSLEDVAILGKLKGLQVLSCVHSYFQQLPEEIGQLTELRMLDLNYCRHLQIIEPDVLGRLIKLEELYMENSFNQWNPVEQTQPTNASLIELNHLKYLCTLHVSIPDPSMLPEDLDVKKLTKYKIQIGNAQGWREGQGSRILYLEWDSISDVLRKGCIQSILSRTDDLFLTELNGSEQSICALSQEGFPKLKHLLVENSSSIQYILQCHSLSAFEMLESLLLIKLNNLTKICYNHNSSSKSFGKLKVIQVESCDKMEVLFPLSLLRVLPQLEEIKVVSCMLMHGIVDVDDCGKAELQNLRIMNLHQLPNVKNFFTTGTTLLSSTLEDQVGTQIAFFNGQQVAFQRLETLEIIGLDSLKFIFFPSMVKSLTQLKKLTISDCEKTEAIIMEEEGLGMETSEILAFPMLTDLHLERLKSLTCFSHGKCARESGSQDHVTSRATVLFNQEDSRYIQHLQTLDVLHCDGLLNMFTPTIAENLVALTKLRISNCRILTEVINDEKGGDVRVVAFNQLKYMELDGLIGLRSFSLGGYTLMFPLLEDIIVTKCPNMKFFSQGPMEASKLKRVQVSKEVWFWARNLNITIQNMFEEMGTFAGVEKMLLSEFPGLIGKWHNELNPIKSYWQLKSVVVDKCPSFINAIPSISMLVLDNLSYLQVHDCELLEEIFDLEGLEVVESTRVLPQLRELNLVNLPKLRRLWNRDLQESLCFNSLESLILYNCSNLGHAFSPSMAQCLANLELMEIKECGQMEGVIVEEEGEGSATEKITFSKLRRMTMEYLPNLTCFLLGKNHILECPKLQKMIIAHCPKMESLIGQSQMEDDHSTPSFFTSQVQFPKLRSMDLSHMDNLSKIWTDSPQETLTFDCLCKVEVRNCKGLENLFPYWVTTSLTHLEKLQVESCEIKEIVANGGDTPRSNTTQDLFPKLTSLVLRDMPRLKSFYPNLPTLHWPLLEELQVTHCDKLNMLSFTASMNSWAQQYDQQDLSNQEAHSSFERDFPNFERLLLVNNNIHMIQDGNFPDDIFSKPIALTLACFHDEKAVFPLKFLLERFQNLQSLEVFCSSFEDIFLDEGLVDNGKHPVLESLGELKLNKLHNLKSVWREGSLVLKILHSINTFEVWDCPCLTTIFPTVTSFQKLTYLEVKNCSGLVHLVTVSAVTNLMHLGWMTIIGCERMKEVVANDGNGEEKVISFGNLHTLTLQDLPSLECFSSISSCTFRFPCLWTIKVEECPKIKTFSKGTLSTPRLVLVSLFRYKWQPGNWEKSDDLNTIIQKLSA